MDSENNLLSIPCYLHNDVFRKLYIDVHLKALYALVNALTALLKFDAEESDSTLIILEEDFTSAYLYKGHYVQIIMDQLSSFHKQMASSDHDCLLAMSW